MFFTCSSLILHILFTLSWLFLHLFFTCSSFVSLFVLHLSLTYSLLVPQLFFHLTFTWSSLVLPLFFHVLPFFLPLSFTCSSLKANLAYSPPFVINLKYRLINLKFFICSSNILQLFFTYCSLIVHLFFTYCWLFLGFFFTCSSLVCVGGMNSNDRVKPNSMLRIGWVVVMWGFWYI